jgi:hypothetical protein
VGLAEILVVLVAVLLPAAIIVAGIWLALALGKARAARAEAEAGRQAAVAERDQAVAARNEEAARAATALADAEAERSRVADAQAEAEAARKLAEERGDDVAAANARVEEAAAAAASADARVHELTDRLAAVTRDGGADPSILLALELSRAERRWRHSVAAGPTDPSPFPGAPDPVRVALEVEVQALREEAGVLLGLDWRLAEPLAPGAALRVLRAAQEIAADAATIVEEASLVVTPDEGGVRIAVEPPPDRPLPSLAALAATGLLTDGASVVVPA